AAADRRLSGIFVAPAVAAQHDRIGNGAIAETEITADTEAPEIAAAHGGVPARPDVARLFVGCDAIVDDDIGIRDTAHRSVAVVDRRASPGIAASQIGGPSAHDRREMNALGIRERGALDGILGT